MSCSSSCSSCVSSPIIVQNDIQCFTYSLRHYADVAPSVGVGVEYEEDPCLAYHSVLPLEVRGAAYSPLHLQPLTCNPQTQGLTVKQLTMDIEHYLGEDHPHHGHVGRALPLHHRLRRADHRRLPRHLRRHHPGASAGARAAQQTRAQQDEVLQPPAARLPDRLQVHVEPAVGPTLHAGRRRAGGVRAASVGAPRLVPGGNACLCCCSASSRCRRRTRAPCTC